MNMATETTPSPEAAAEAVTQAGARLEAVTRELGKVIFGQGEVIGQALITVLAGGHGLLVGVPGLAKTLLVESLGTVLGLGVKRIQFTPDLLPSDILGAEVLDEDATGKRQFRFIKGPVFTQLLMADEINRASPRTQSALLQAMQEREVTIAGETHALPRPFHVLATQNPIEQEGTYPLPEAQLDRFMCQINVDYPDEAAERDILTRTTGAPEDGVQEVLKTGELATLQTLVRTIPVGDTVVEAILGLVRAARPALGDDDVLWGPGPRAGQSLMLAVKAAALLEGRFAPSVDDVKALAAPVLRHRIALGFAARSRGMDIETHVRALIKDL